MTGQPEIRARCETFATSLDFPNRLGGRDEVLVHACLLGLQDSRSGLRSLDVHSMSGCRACCRAKANAATSRASVAFCSAASGRRERWLWLIAALAPGLSCLSQALTAAASLDSAPCSSSWSFVHTRLGGFKAELVCTVGSSKGASSVAGSFVSLALAMASRKAPRCQQGHPLSTMTMKATLQGAG